MLIGDQYNDEKLYRGVKYYDSMPLASGDLHEQLDINFMKNAYLMNNLLGYGTINSPHLDVTENGISLSEPSVLMIDGDISLIKNDDGTELVTIQDIQEIGVSEGIIAIVGWYQHIQYDDTIRKYGGVKNAALENDLLNKKFNMQISTRYQFRWFPILVSQDAMYGDELSLEFLNRDKHGDITSGTSIVNSYKKVGHIFLAEAPDTMDYAVSNLYIAPIVKYSYVDGKFTSVQACQKITVGSGSGGSEFIVQNTTPEGSYPNGTTWFNPDNREFRTYVEESGGWVASASTMGFLQYQSIYVISETLDTPQNIEVPIAISEFAEGDILRVIYEGLELIKDEHYTVDYENKSITLNSFTTKKDDKVLFIVTKIVEASDITNITETFLRHMNTNASSTNFSHVKLSDTPSDSDSSSGIAATPKMVKEISDKLDKLSSDFDPINKGDLITRVSNLEKLGKTVVLTSIGFSPNNYIADSTYEDYPFRATYVNTKIKASQVPIATYSPKDAISGIHCPVAETADGRMYFYASEKPSGIVNILSVVLKEGDSI